MDKNRIKKDELFNAYNNGKLNSKGEYPRGKYKLGRFTIGDDHEFTKHYLTVDDIFIYSSNIGTLQLAQRLSGKEMYEGLKSFGITEKTQIDLPYEKVGVMPTIRQFSAGEDKGEDNVFKATISYGQGMTATFMQMLKAYSAFNNNGIIVTPKIVQSLSVNDKKVSLADDTQKRVISKKTANEIKRLLVKTITKGTGVNAQVEGIEVGGKTGTAQIARHGKYQDIYISSFFGFANDKNKKYTIGVTVINPISTEKYWYYHYASWSAVPVFKEVVNNLVKLNYLTKSADN
jgi:cell division protein FtsI (penicillin-binding protein 3)